ncbi:MAG: MotA/TolQ/ExbB proton channel family protein [Candidatus Omnitrophica bacterium]|nr:MotA/TolQ/ExbB proton channel family protein [Candidatus Omnitrophota bacterium]
MRVASKISWAIFAGLTLGAFWVDASFAQQNVKPLINYVAQTKQESMTLWQILKAGGGLMFLLAALSIVAMTIVIYDFIWLKPSRLCPKEFGEKMMTTLEEGDLKAALKMCSTETHITANIVRAGLEKRAKGRLLAKEAIENRARREVDSLWQNINYLSDIAQVAPLVGLLGTVLGMIQAFNVVAFQSVLVKPIVLAGGISKAMVTTAGGLFVAIPSLIFYSFFRTKVQEITSEVESYCSDLVKIFER